MAEIQTSVEWLAEQLFKDATPTLRQMALIEEAKEMESKQAKSFPNIGNVNRVEVIDENGRSYVNWEINNSVEIQIQDSGKTLKVFVSQK